ncbi:unnamed protein product [Caenorhabditis angaria]|uniref:Uncharacterized protein n=1 Tax=Caenorhabditis angaria TaxID=860376 RepID=A0A9P1IXT3_9PELO|nr:unnamed protein product [Caenorhabditis angaria]
MLFPGQVLKCLSGHTLYANQCTSTSYCVTIRSKSGQIQRSCDGNNLAQISLCSIYAMHGYPKNVYTEYSSQPVNMGGPIQSSQISNKNSRHSRSKIGSTMCFDGGDLGEVCCCNTDYSMSNYILEQLNESHAAEISEFLNSSFLVEEPLNRAAKMPEHCFKPFVEKLISRTLNIPFTFVYRSKEDNKIVACSMSSIWRSTDVHDESDFTFENENKSIEAIGNILSKLHDSLFVLRPDLKNVLHL